MAQDAPTSVPLSAAIAAAQHKAALWADASLFVYAVAMGARIGGLTERLAGADSQIADYDCLLPGALEPEVAAGAPYLVRLKQESPLTDWLLFEAAGTLGDWGVLVRSPARLMPLRNHLRELLQARLPAGQAVALDWMDPPVLRAVLPLFGPAELAAFFGPVQALTIPGATAWSHAELVAGRLLQREVPLAKAA